MKSFSIALFTFSLLIGSFLMKKPKSKLDIFINKYNPDKAAQDCNKHSWRSCYEIKKNKCISWGWTLIPKGCAVVYEKCNYIGTTQIICGNLRRLKTMNKKISSIKLGPNTDLELFSKRGWKGKNKSFSYNEPCLISNNFNAQAQSLRVSIRLSK